MTKRSRRESDSLSSDTEQDFVTAVARLGIAPAFTSSAQGTAKFVHLDRESGETAEVMQCSLPPHRETLSFTSFDDYEVHYNKAHVNRCIECRKNFPTPHFLNLHQEENHDPLIQVLKARGERTFSCFVEDCERKCSTAQKRRMHLIDKHMFPKDYDFCVVDDGIDHRSSLLKSGKHRRRSATTQIADAHGRSRRRSLMSSTIQGRVSETGSNISPSSDQIEEANPENGKYLRSVPVYPQRDGDVDDLTGALSALKFVPPSVRFGRGRGMRRGGFSKE
ncbi:MAG: hypothetical protein M1818_000269 [Claussenomyces sp. TS43310]|nr:MAG: hypothetical protein M1818_000269 [Claussenomyces sp. TS43310]